MRGTRRLAVMVAALALGAGLTGCSAQRSSVATPTQSAWVVQPTPVPSGSAAPGGAAAAAQRKTAFDQTIESALSKNASATGQSVAAALEAAGFPRSSVQFSASKTSAGLAPGSIIVSAQVGSSCLIGQWGPAVGGYHSVVAPVLDSGGCLVGGRGVGAASTSGGQLGD